MGNELYAGFTFVGPVRASEIDGTITNEVAMGLCEFSWEVKGYRENNHHHFTQVVAIYIADITVKRRKQNDRCGQVYCIIKG